MRVLFVHHNFPAQFRHLARHLAQQPQQGVVAIGEAAKLERNGAAAAGIRCEGYPPPPDIRRRAESVRDLAARCAREGYEPDVICAHAGWGEALLLKDVFPGTPLLGYFEYFFANRADLDFDPEFPARETDERRIRGKDAILRRGLETCDWGLTPTVWQRDQFPPQYHDRMSVIFDGIDASRLTPDPAAKLEIGGRRLTPADEVITFVSRNLEPYRGFHVFMRALPRLLRERPRAHVIICGGDLTGYGRPPDDGRSWREVLLDEVGRGLDAARVHFLGRVPYATFVKVLQVSSAHVYLTYPFVLSWSMLEAMSCGCAVVASATPPVMEVIDDGVNGLLVDFFNREQLVDALHRVLDDSGRMEAMRAAARQTVVQRYDLATICLPRQLALLERMSGRTGT